MSYSIEAIHSAEKELNRLDTKIYRIIERIIDSLAEQPRPNGSKKLTDSKNLWRIRVGRIRLIYSVDDIEKKVTIVRVVKRDESTYEGLLN